MTTIPVIQFYEGRTLFATQLNSMVAAILAYVPSLTSQLTNDIGYTRISLFSQLTNDIGALTGAPVTSVNGLTGAVVLSYPTKTSQLTNDAGFVVASSVPTTTGQLFNNSGYITAASVPTAVSQLVNDLGLITSAPVLSVNGATGAITITTPTATSQLVNDSGYITAASIHTATSQLVNDSGFITSAPVSSVNGYTGAVVLSLPQTFSSGDIKESFFSMSGWLPLSYGTISYSYAASSYPMLALALGFSLTGTFTTPTITGTLLCASSVGYIKQ
jgi:adhesin HecA-like repeat protein